MNSQGLKLATHWLLTMALVLFGLKSHATTVLPMNVNDLIARSSIVIHGKVVQMDVNEKGYRVAVVEALEVLRAPEEFRQRRDFHIPLFNRAVPHSDWIDYVPSAPELVLLEELVIFLDPIAPEEEGFFKRLDGQRLFSLHGFHQGKMRVLPDAAGVRRVAAWNELPEPLNSLKDLKKQKTTKRFGVRTASKMKYTLDADRLTRLRSLDELGNRVREVRTHSR